MNEFAEVRNDVGGPCEHFHPVASGKNDSSSHPADRLSDAWHPAGANREWLVAREPRRRAVVIDPDKEYFIALRTCGRELK